MPRRKTSTANGHMTSDGLRLNRDGSVDRRQHRYKATQAASGRVTHAEDRLAQSKALSARRKANGWQGRTIPTTTTLGDLTFREVLELAQFGAFAKNAFAELEQVSISNSKSS